MKPAPDLGARFAAAARRDGVPLTLDPSMVSEVAFGATLMAAVVRGAERLDAQWRAADDGDAAGRRVIAP